MSTEVSRTEYGMSDKGNVCVITFNNSNDKGNAVYTYQVRHGVRTVAEFTVKAKAEALARSITA